MKTVYISSTREDLKEHRQTVAETLRDCDYKVEAMEKYPARDDTPLDASQSDAKSCDLYVGIFAWRYGYIPTENNPEKKSITELEYIAAERAGKPRLVSVLAEDAPWDPAMRDDQKGPEAGKKILDLRKRLTTERWAAFFKSADHLARQVLTSVIQHEATKPIADNAAMGNVQAPAEMGGSFLPNLQKQMDQLGDAEYVTLRLGPTPWWNTRLHLAAALASDFTMIRQFILLDAAGRFITMSSPTEIRRALTKSLPKLELAYLRSCDQARAVASPEAEVDRIIVAYPAAVQTTFATPAETNIKQIVTATKLGEIGIRPEGEVLVQFPTDHRPLLSDDLMRRRSPYILLMRGTKLEGVIDRAELASRLALFR